MSSGNTELWETLRLMKKCSVEDVPLETKDASVMPKADNGPETSCCDAAST